MPLIQRSGLWVSNCEPLSRARRSITCGVCGPPPSFPTARCVRRPDKGGRERRASSVPGAAAGTFVRNHQPPGFLRRARGRGAPVHLREPGVWWPPCQISPTAGPCLMSVAPGVQLKPCLFRQPRWLRHASPAPSREGQAPEEALFLSSFRTEPWPALAKVKRILAKACWGPESRIS